MSHSYFYKKKMEIKNDSNDEVRFFIRQGHHLKYVVYVTCSLSVFGSLLIILTYLLFRELRTKVRLILLHLSIMDLGIGLSNLIGTAVNFDKYYDHYHGNSEWAAPTNIRTLCKVQASFAMYTTYSSVFWTNCLGLYLYFAVVRCSSKTKRILFWTFLAFCYVMPLILTLWLLFTDKLGPAPYGSGGWCTIINVDPSTRVKYYFSMSFGYDMWIYLTFVLVPILYIGTRAHISLEIERSKQFIHPSRLWSAVHAIDYKFLLIPLAFVFLRIWTCVVNIITDYSDVLHHIMQNKIEGCRTLVSLLFYLSAIGDSGQGAANGVIFVLFTKKVREKLFGCIRFKRGHQILEESDPLNAKKRNKSISSEQPTPSNSPVSSEQYDTA